MSQNIGALSTGWVTTNRRMHVKGKHACIEWWAWPNPVLFAICLFTLFSFLFVGFGSISDCGGLTSTFEVSTMQDEALNLLLESCGGKRMGHILLILPHIRSAADRQLIQVKTTHLFRAKENLFFYVYFFVFLFFLRFLSLGIIVQENRRWSGHWKTSWWINAQLKCKKNKTKKLILFRLIKN